MGVVWGYDRDSRLIVLYFSYLCKTSFNLWFLDGSLIAHKENFADSLPIERLRVDSIVLAVYVYGGMCHIRKGFLSGRDINPYI